jgi:hypothetical protein
MAWQEKIAHNDKYQQHGPLAMRFHTKELATISLLNLLDRLHHGGFSLTSLRRSVTASWKIVLDRDRDVNYAQHMKICGFLSR